MDSLPWDAAGLGPLDFAEQLLVFTEDEPESAAADIERLKQERIEMQQLQDRDDSSGAGPSTSPVTTSSGTKRRLTEGGDEKESKAMRAEGMAGISEIALNKACREKARRCRLNDRFGELATLLEEPGQGGPKTDKATILISAISAVTNLRREIGQLRQLNKYLEERVAQFEKESSRQMYQQVLAYNGLQQQPGGLPSQAAAAQAPAQAQLQQKAMLMPHSAAMVSQQQQHLLQQHHQAVMQQQMALPGIAPAMYQVVPQPTASTSDAGPSSSAAAMGAADMASMAQIQALQQSLHMNGGANVAAQGKHPMMPYGTMPMQMPMAMPVQMQVQHHNNSFIPTAMNPSQDAQLRPPVA